MEAKQSSRRLRGLAPEENGLGVCLICQGDFSIEELRRLHHTICSGTLFHRRCFQEMNARTSNCAACRHEHEPNNPRALNIPLDISLEVLVGDLEEANIQFLVLGDPQGTLTTMRFQAQVSEEIHEYRQTG